MSWPREGVAGCDRAIRGGTIVAFETINVRCANAMADIVLSYAREDRGQAKLVADALEHSGWSVWWDRAILPGTSYRQVIEAQLSAVRCVVVLWSAAARQSN